MPTKSLLLLMLVAFAGISYAQSCTAPYSITNSQIQSLFQDGIFLAALALTVSFDVVAIGYIIGKLFPTTGVLSWIRNEYWEIAKSAMLIAGIYAIIILIGSLAAPFASQIQGLSSSASSIATLVDNAQNYLCTASNQVTNDMNYVGGMSIGIGVWKNSRIGTYVGIPIPLANFAFIFGIIFNPYVNSMLESRGGMGPWDSLLNTLIMMIGIPVEMVLVFQLDLIGLIVTFGLAVLIPAGLVMRAFPFIRGVGGTLIAIGIGMSIIYPAALALLNAPLSSILQSNFVWATPAPPPSSANPFWIDVYSDVVNGVVGAVISGALGTNGGNGYSAGIGSFPSIYPGLNGIVNNSIYSIFQLVLFIVDLIIVFPLIDSIAKMLGGTIRLRLGGKLKLA